MTSVAVAQAPSSARPGWWRTALGVGYGYLLAAVCLTLAVVPLAIAGLVTLRQSGGAAGAISGPFYADGTWAAASNLVVAAIVVVVTTTCVALGVLYATGRETSFAITAAALVLTGGAPYLGLHLLLLSGGAGFVAVVVTVRYAAVDRAEATLPWRRIVPILGVALLIPMSYGATHPLTVTGGGSGLREGRIYALVVLHNAGFDSLELLSSSVPLRASNNPFEPSTAQPFAPIVIGARRTVSFSTGLPGCPPAPIRVRYRIYGQTVSQTIVPQSCPG